MTSNSESAAEAGVEGQMAGGAATPDQPVSGADRIVSLDFIRGIAILGILFANITAFGQPFTAYYWPPAITGGANAVDNTWWLFQFVFIDGKFRGLFTLLFGAGLYLFMEKAWARGSSRWLQARRLAWLLLFGLIHFFLIWMGDILTLYAVWGIVALSLLKLKRKTQLVAGITILSFGTLLITLMMGSQFAAANIESVRAQLTPEQSQQIATVEERTFKDVQEELAIYRDGSYGDIVAHQLGEAGQMFQTVLFVGPVETLGLILIGISLFRYGLFSGGLDRRKMISWGWTGVISGCVLATLMGLWPYASGFPFFTTMFVFNGLGQLPHLITVLGLVSLLAAWAPSAAQTPLGQRFVAAGRMAFSNYLGTSILMIFVFHGWALGLYGQFHRLALFGVVAVVWMLMLFWSKWWLARFRYGPLEWCWRCLTYWTLFPIKR